MKLLLIALVLIFIPIDIVGAAPADFITCDGTTCSACDIVDILNKAIIWLFGAVFLLFTYLMVIAGFGLITSNGNTSALEAAKSKFTNAIIGLIIMMSAWLIVDTLMRTIVGGGSGEGVSNAPIGELEGWGPWSTVKCQKQTPTVTPEVGDDEGVVVGDQNCPTCIPINAPNITCKSQSSCTIVPEYNNKLQNITMSMIVTEAYPPTRVHQNQCHKNGTCTDIVFSDRNFTLERIALFQQNATAAGFRAVFEPGSDFNGGTCNGIQGECQPYSVTRASGSHFSLY